MAHFLCHIHSSKLFTQDKYTVYFTFTVLLRFSICEARGPVHDLPTSGQVSNDEAEIGIGNVFLTEERARFITFSSPYDFERACFLTPAPRPLPSWMAVSFPFTLPVWILLTG